MYNIKNIENDPKNVVSLCLAKTRQKTLCQSPPVDGKKRCPLHGGAEGSGPPKGNQNAVKHGKYRAEAIASRRETKRLLRGFPKILKLMFGRGY